MSFFAAIVWLSLFLVCATNGQCEPCRNCDSLSVECASDLRCRVLVDDAVNPNLPETQICVEIGTCDSDCSQCGTTEELCEGSRANCFLSVATSTCVGADCQLNCIECTLGDGSDCLASEAEPNGCVWNTAEGCTSDSPQPTTTVYPTTAAPTPTPSTTTTPQPTRFPTEDPTRFPTREPTTPPTDRPTPAPTTPVLTCETFDSNIFPKEPFVSWQIEFSDEYRVTFDACASTFDTILELYDESESVLLASDDNGCGSGNQSIIVYPAWRGAYVLRLVSKSGPAVEGWYDIQIRCETIVTTTEHPTTHMPTTPRPSTTIPTTPRPTTPMPTSVKPTSVMPTHVKPTTVMPTRTPTPIPTTPMPTSVMPTSVMPTHVMPTPTPTPVRPTTPSPQPTASTLTPSTYRPTSAVPTSDRECSIDDTNWKLSYLRSFVVEKQKRANRDKGWAVSASMDNEDDDNEYVSYDMNGWSAWKKRRSASCMVYKLSIGDEDTQCFGSAQPIQFWMVNLPQSCNGVSLKNIKRLIYWNAPNTMDVVYDATSNKIGFGKQWTSAQSAPSMPSDTEFTLCLEASVVDPFSVVDTAWFAQGDNGYYAQNGITQIADICAARLQLFDAAAAQTSHVSDNVSPPLSQSYADASLECHMDDTNWRLRYKRSYVSRKKRSKKPKHRGWWRRRTRRRDRRRLVYQHAFSASNEEWYEDADEDYDADDGGYDFFDDDDEDEGANLNVLSSCFVYELQCTAADSMCFGAPTTLSSFVMEIPFTCGGSDVSLPEINHAFYWSDPNNVNVKYDANANKFGFGVDFDEHNQLNIGEKREFRLCFDRDQINAYNMVSSTWKAHGVNEFYSMDGTIFVPDICQIEQV